MEQSIDILKLSKDAYSMASELGYRGSFEEFSKVFKPGHPDPNGEDGVDGTAFMQEQNKKSVSHPGTSLLASEAEEASRGQK